MRGIHLVYRLVCDHRADHVVHGLSLAIFLAFSLPSPASICRKRVMILNESFRFMLLSSQFGAQFWGARWISLFLFSSMEKLVLIL